MLRDLRKLRSFSHFARNVANACKCLTTCVESLELPGFQGFSAWSQGLDHTREVGGSSPSQPIHRHPCQELTGVSFFCHASLVWTRPTRFPHGLEAATFASPLS